MKTRFLITAIIIVSSLVIPQVFGICMENPDWPDAPCYAKRGEDSSLERLQQDWAPYYDFKGSEWMESKKQEMMQAIQNGTLFEWIQLTENTRAHDNVHWYYFLYGDVPNEDGLHAFEYFEEELAPPHDPYSDDERLRMASEKKFDAEESMGGGSGMGFFNDSHFNLTVIIAAIVIGGASGIGLTYYWKSRK